MVTYRHIELLSIFLSLSCWKRKRTANGPVLVRVPGPYCARHATAPSLSHVARSLRRSPRTQISRLKLYECYIRLMVQTQGVL